MGIDSAKVYGYDEETVGNDVSENGTDGAVYIEIWMEKLYGGVMRGDALWENKNKKM